MQLFLFQKWKDKASRHYILNNPINRTNIYSQNPESNLVQIKCICINWIVMFLKWFKFLSVLITPRKAKFVPMLTFLH